MELSTFKQQNNIHSLGFIKSTKSDRYVMIPFADADKTHRVDMGANVVILTKEGFDKDSKQPVFVYSVEKADDDGVLTTIHILSHNQGITAERCEGFI